MSRTVLGGPAGLRRQSAEGGTGQRLAGGGQGRPSGTAQLNDFHLRKKKKRANLVAGWNKRREPPAPVD